MDTYSEIAKALRQIVGRDGNSAPIFTGEVKSVEGETCTVLIGELEVPDVLLTPADDGKDGKLIITPKTGSMVTVADLSGGELRHLSVVQWGEVEKMSLTADSIELNGGENGGVVNIESLKNNLDVLKKHVEAMKNAIANGFTSVGASTAANGPAGRTTFESAMAAQMINFEDMEDTKITH